MSDCYPICDPLVHICSPPEKQLQYILKQWECGNDVVFWIGIQNVALIKWHKVKKETPALTYVDLLNGLIPGQAFKIDRNCERIESRLSGRCCAVSSIQQSLNRKGNSLKRKEHEKKIYRMVVLKSEVYSVERWEADINLMESKFKKAEEEICDWRRKFKDLEKEKEKLVEEMLTEVEKQQQKTQELESENKMLLKHIDMLENESLGIRRGARIPELKTKQAQNRKLKQLKTRAQKALHVVEIFGLDLQLLKLKDPNSANNFSLDFSKNSSTATEEQEEHTPPKLRYDKLHPEEKATVESILYLMDKFGVSDNFMHELTMVVEDFPVKSYLIKHLRTELNKQVKITTTPSLAPGVQYSLYFKELLTDKVRAMVSVPLVPHWPF